MRTRNRTQTAGESLALGDKKVGRSSRSRIWNLRLELGHQLHPTAMRLTEFAEASSPPPENTSVSPPAAPEYGPPTFAKTWKRDRLEGHDFALQPDGTLRCPTDHPLYPQERRPERDGTLRVVYAARIGHCRPCPLREQCQWHGTATKKPRRVSAVLSPLSAAPALPTRVESLSACKPLLWGDWGRRAQRRECIQLLRSQRVDVRVEPPGHAKPAIEPSPLSRAYRAHWRLSWAQRLARNARAPTASPVTIMLFGVPPGFAAFLGLSTV